jgi:raffinose/stachyose/melibiose transport system permease protein
VKRATTFLTRAAIFGILSVFAFAALYPLVFMLFTSLRTSAEYLDSPLALPSSFTYFENFLAMTYRFNVPRLFLNTIAYIALSSTICLTASIPAAFALAKLRFPCRRVFFMLMVASLAIPAITFIIPDYILMAQLGLVDNPTSVVLLWSAQGVPSTVFLLTSLMRALPSEILEAASVDGANYYHLMTRVVVPISVPGIITVAIFNVTVWWNDLLIPLVFLQSEARQTVTAGVATIVGRFTSDYPLLVTGLLMASIPPILIYIFLQRYIRRGLIIGAVK